MAEVTLDQQRALALASARARANQAQNVTGQFSTALDGTLPADAADVASTTPPGGTYPRQPACTAAGYECVQDGFPPKACYDAEQHCNIWSYIYRNSPPSDHTLTTVFPNGSTVIIPPGYDPVLGRKSRPFGQAPGSR